MRFYHNIDKSAFQTIDDEIVPRFDMRRELE